ncbi:two component transcriptional regulator, AraC family [Anaerovirgula multivorans]|uniref:Stage 0 sporulation protein A homolog n=1 Tax=Anaerovirgula multivorans TaxID=312168 RepID=A0A239ASG9_9FIRM|nr:response regulator [Anaerovirgula multivorans]SNR98281.1 two component transcriptional regulator, AraC family [Anaerovirgula multivorans]
MIKLLIADDEHIVIESLKFIIEKSLDGVEIVATARSGREAIEKTLNLKPDVVLMDIHMPGINGMDAIRHIKSTHPDVLFIIITAYEYFQYAKDAVNLGVFEYLLKPVNRQKVIKTIQDAKEVIYNRRETIQREMILREKIDKIIPHMEGQFIYSQLLNSGIIKDINFYEEIFATKLEKGYVMMAIVKEIESLGKEENLKNSLLKQKFYNFFQLELKNLTRCLIGPPLLDRITAYIPIVEDMDDYEVRNQAIDYGKKIMMKINKLMKIDYTIGIGKSYDIQHFSQSVNEAYIATSLSEENDVIHFEDIHFSSNTTADYPAGKDKMLLHKILTGELKEVLEIFEEIFWWMSTYYKEDIDQIKSKLIELVILIQKTIPSSVEGNYKLEDGYLIQILKIKNIEELKISYLNYLKTIVVNLETSKEKEIKGLITKAIKYIDKNFNQNISLNDVAKEMNMSYHYFSKFFKDSTGENFVDYLTNLRIEKSKDILKDATVNVKEVCFEVGYSDPNYFSKIFKKITGMTPTEYRANGLSQEVM